MSEFFNEVIKNKYLESIENEGSRTVTKYIFVASKSIEEILEMDLYNFSADHVAEILKNMNTKSPTTAQSHLSMIRTYINWCIVNGYRESNINPLESLGEDFYSQFVDTTVKQFISRSELDEILKQLVNYQDKIIPLLLFNGVYGAESSEIRNLRFTDIQEDGTTRLYDDIKGERYIKLDDSVIEMLRKANYEEEYMNKNGLAEGNSPNSLLIDSEFIVKNLKRGAAKEGHRVSQGTIIKRINIIQDFFALPDLTPKSIWRSGMLYMAYQSMGDREQLIKEDFEKIGEHFNLSKINNNGYENYNRAYLSRFINEENINKLYK